MQAPKPVVITSGLQWLNQRLAPMKVTRRELLQGALLAGAAGLLGTRLGAAQNTAVITRPIPKTGEALPVVGLGSWITFNVGDDPKLLEECAAVMAAFFEAGGRMIDSSPMYGSAQRTIGYGLEKLANPRHLFAAEKVWISSVARGKAQIEQSRGLLGCATPRPRAGAQSRLVGGALADAVRDEGAGRYSLRRHHHVRGSSASRVRSDHGQR